MKIEGRLAEKKKKGDYQGVEGRQGKVMGV